MKTNSTDTKEKTRKLDWQKYDWRKFEKICFEYIKVVYSAKFDNLNFDLGDDLSINLNDTYELTHSYTVMAIMRNYINLGSSKRFALFAETQLKFGGSQSKLVTKSGQEVSGTYSTSTDLGIGVSPGIVAFVNNYTAVEVSVGVLGVDFGKVHQKKDQILLLLCR